jgi:hypothetical protein
MNSFQQRLYELEVDPPASAWGKIADVLDREGVHEFPQKLHDAAVTPPPAVWERISAGLDAGVFTDIPVAADASFPLDSAPVIPMSARPSKIRPVLRFAIAAAILAAVATTAFFVFNQKSGEQVISEAGTTARVSAGQPDTGLAVVLPQPAVSPETTPDTPDNPMVTTTRERNSGVAPAPRNTTVSQDQATGSEYMNSLYAYEDHVPSIAERYVMLMTPDGNFIRMSKKLGPLVCCVTGQEQDEQCSSQIRKLQQQLATSPIGTGNVLDVLNIVNSLGKGTQL